MYYFHHLSSFRLHLVPHSDTCTHTLTHTYKHTKNSQAQTHMNAYKLTHTYMHTHARTHACTHTHTLQLYCTHGRFLWQQYEHTHTHSHTHTHTHNLSSTTIILLNLFQNHPHREILNHQWQLLHDCSNVIKNQYILVICVYIIHFSALTIFRKSISGDINNEIILKSCSTAKNRLLTLNTCTKQSLVAD